MTSTGETRCSTKDPSWTGARSSSSRSCAWIFNPAPKSSPSGSAYPMPTKRSGDAVPRSWETSPTTSRKPEIRWKRMFLRAGTWCCAGSLRYTRSRASSPSPERNCPPGSPGAGNTQSRPREGNDPRQHDSLPSVQHGLG